MRRVDPVTAEVIRCGLETIADEMGIIMMQTAKDLRKGKAAKGHH